jgi:hypothetical protein
MDKQKAIEAIANGSKVTHKRFLPDEWIAKHETSAKHYIDEKENVISMGWFWKYRTHVQWDTDWKVFIRV